jgi:hypothetical protein
VAQNDQNQENVLLDFNFLALDEEDIHLMEIDLNDEPDLDIDNLEPQNQEEAVLEQAQISLPLLAISYMANSSDNSIQGHLPASQGSNSQNNTHMIEEPDLVPIPQEEGLVLGQPAQAQTNQDDEGYFLPEDLIQDIEHPIIMGDDQEQNQEIEKD